MPILPVFRGASSLTDFLILFLISALFLIKFLICLLICFSLMLSSSFSEKARVDCPPPILQCLVGFCIPSSSGKFSLNLSISVPLSSSSYGKDPPVTFLSFHSVIFFFAYDSFPILLFGIVQSSSELIHFLLQILNYTPQSFDLSIF